MTRRTLVLTAVAVVAAVALASLVGQRVLLGLRFAFVLAGAVPIGAVLLLAIGRVTGADWRGLSPLAAPLPLAALLGVTVLNGTAAPLPPHLATWQYPALVGLRALVVLLLWIVAGRRLAAGASVTFAAVTLALYAALVTPIAADWLLGAVPGRPVSAVGMMLATHQVAAACAAALLLGLGDERLRRDLAGLLVAATLGLAYLAFVDLLIIWFGNLPARVGFYADRMQPLPGAIATLALLLGVGGPILAPSLLAGDRGRRVGAAGALAGLTLFDGWWLELDPLGALVGLVAVALGGFALHRDVARG